MSPEEAFRIELKEALDPVISSTPRGSHPRHGQALPYVVFGETDLEEHVSGHLLRTYIHIQSKVEGPHEANDLARAIHGAVHNQSYSGNSWTFTCIRVRTSDTTFDPNDQVWHTVMRIECVASE